MPALTRTLVADADADHRTMVVSSQRESAWWCSCGERAEGFATATMAREAAARHELGLEQR